MVENAIVLLGNIDIITRESRKMKENYFISL